MRHVVLVGVNGQLGSDLRRPLADFRVSALTHNDLGVCDATRADTVIAELKPDVVINTSAFHKVEVCEEQPAAALAVNATAVYEPARLARRLDCTLIHFTTDYLFDGRAGTPYAEDSLPNPLSVYGISKLAGQYLVRAFCPRHYLIRSTGLCGASDVVYAAAARKRFRHIDQLRGAA